MSCRSRPPCTAAGTALAPPVQAQSTAMVVRNDRGGLLGQRNAEIRALRASGQRVE